MFRKVAILVVLLFSIVHTSAFAAPLSQAEAEGNPWWLWLIIFAVIALFVGFMLWWWLREPEEQEGVTTARHTPAGVYASPDMPEAAVDDGQVVAADTAPQDTQEILRAEGPVDSGPTQMEPEAMRRDDAGPDDLTIVEGIGPAIHRVLDAAGIRTYQDLATADPDRLEAILQEADPNLARLFDPTTWPDQARLAANGDWEALETLKQQLSAGRRRA